MCKLIGFLGSRDVFFVTSKFNNEMQAMFCGRILPSLYSFSCGSDFAKTEYYSPSNLLVRSATYHYQPVENDTWHHSKHSMIILVTKPISFMPVLLGQQVKKILPVKRITQGKSKPLVENIFSYQSSYWGMSTLAAPVLLYRPSQSWSNNWAVARAAGKKSGQQEQKPSHITVVITKAMGLIPVEAWICLLWQLLNPFTPKKWSIRNTFEPHYFKLS